MTVEKTLIVTAEEEKRIKSTYERNEIEIEKDVADIKEWLKKQPHLPQDEGTLLYYKYKVYLQNNVVFQMIYE